MGRGQTTDEFAAERGPLWYMYGGLPGDPGWVSDPARQYGDLYGLDAEALDEQASKHGWEFHNKGYGAKIRKLAVLMQAAKRTEDAPRQLGEA